jgi:RNA polymerase sigma-70 factor, ECF subfamily
MPDSFDAPRPVPDAAFVRALTESQTALRAYCEAALGHCEEAKDAWQKANIVLWQKSGEWDSQTRFLPWALAVARYEVLAVIRDRHRERLMFDDDVALMMADASVKHADTHDARTEALARCAEKLQPRHREVLNSHYVFGHAQAEIAEAHGMGLSAVKVLLLRLRRSLAECIERQLHQQSSL